MISIVISVIRIITLINIIGEIEAKVDGVVVGVFMKGMVVAHHTE
jgi:hypothetical protein